MRIEIFDDKHSLSHLILGGLACKIPFITPLFLLYEVVEFCYKRKRKKETVQHFIGDLVEFMLGFGYGYLTSQIPFNIFNLLGLG